MDEVERRDAMSGFLSFYFNFSMETQQQVRDIPRFIYPYTALIASNKYTEYINDVAIVSNDKIISGHFTNETGEVFICYSKYYDNHLFYNQTMTVMQSLYWIKIFNIGTMPIDEHIKNFKYYNFLPDARAGNPNPFLEWMGITLHY